MIWIGILFCLGISSSQGKSSEDAADAKRYCYTPVDNGRSYRGGTNKTSSDKTCQEWKSKSPHKHNYDPESERYLLEDLEENYCRNPSDASGGPWCYTTDDKKRWEYCFNRCQGDFDYGVSDIIRFEALVGYRMGKIGSKVPGKQMYIYLSGGKVYLHVRTKKALPWEVVGAHCQKLGDSFFGVVGLRGKFMTHEGSWNTKWDMNYAFGGIGRKQATDFYYTNMAISEKRYAGRYEDVWIGESFANKKNCGYYYKDPFYFVQTCDKNKKLRGFLCQFS